MKPTRTRSRRPARPALRIDSLEDRTAPANLAVMDAYFLGRDGERMEEPTIGTRSRIQVEFTQEGVSAGTQYQVSLSVYGLITETFSFKSTTAGAVTLTATTDTAYLIDPGSVPAVVHLDVGDVIPETNANDNDQTFAFTPTAFTAGEGKFIQPLGGTPLVNWYINNYVDLDPDPGKTEIQDYHGGNETYDGHDALDIPIGGWLPMDIGVPVRAVASGVVIKAEDIFFDRNEIDLDSDENPPVNLVVIDHGNGWHTSYLHLRQYSVTVKEGDVVKPGDVIGLVGSSGRSSGPHLHFAVTHYGLTVETYMSPADYWISPAPYIEGNPVVFGADLKTYYIAEKAGAATLFLTDPSGAPVPQLVTYTTFEDGAESNVDYDHTTGTELVFLPTPVTIPINNDGEFETTEDLLVKVQNVDTADADWLTVQIVDDDFPIHFDDDGNLSISTQPGLHDDTVGLSVKDGYLVINTNLGDTLFPLDYGPGVKSITVNTWDGNDHIIINFAGVALFPEAKLYVNGDGGFDELWFGNSNLIELSDSEVSTALATIPYVPNGVDIIRIDPADVGPAVVKVNGTPANIAQLTVNGSAGDWDDKIYIDAVAPNTAVEIDPGGGDDAVHFGYTNGNLDPIATQLPIFVHGGSGAFDALSLWDQGNLNDNMYSLVAGGVSNAGFIRNSTLFIDYEGFEAFGLDTGSGDDHVAVRSTLRGIQTHINTWAGDDDVRVDSNAYNVGGTVNTIRGLLHINGGFDSLVGIDTLTLNDESDATSNSLTVTPDSVLGDATFFGPGGILKYGGFKSLKIQLGTKADTIYVQGTAAGTATLIKGGRGSDTFKVSAPDLGKGPDGGGLADFVQSLLALDGELGEDTLTVDDSLDKDDTKATFTPNTIGAAADDNLFGPGGKLSYASMTTVHLLTGSGRDTVDFWGVDSLTTATVSTGDNDDRVNVTPVGRNMEQARTLSIVGGAGRDSLLVDDRNNPYSLPALSNQYTVTPTLVRRYFKLPSGSQAVPAAVGFSSIEDLTLNTGTKGDTVKIENGPARTTLNTGDGKDTIIAGQIGMNLESVKGLTVNGGKEFDTLLLNDQNNPYIDALNRQYTMTGSLVGRYAKPQGVPQPVFVSVGYGEIENLTVNTGKLGDIISVDSTSAMTNLNAGGGDDVIKVANSDGTIDGVKGDLFVNGNGHVAGDSLVLNDGGGLGGQTYTITGHLVARTGAALITYNSTEAVTINAGNGNDTFTINSTFASAPVKINAGPGDDQFSINTPTGLDPIQGAVTIDGQGNAGNTLGDQLELKDVPKVAGQIYTIDTTTVARAGMAVVTYLGMERVGLTGGSGPDTFNIRGTAAPLGFAVDGHLGSDTYKIGSIANTLTAVGSVQIEDVAGGLDQLFVNDQGNMLPSNYVVAPTLISGGVPAFVISYGMSAPLEKVTLNTSAANDLVRVTGIKAGTAVSIDAGGGTSDTLDYTAYTTPVAVNLSLGTATDFAGGIKNFENVNGGARDDILVGSAGSNLLRGGGGRDILIGRAGVDGLFGGDDDDLLFDGTTNYDLDPAGLASIQAVWLSAQSYSARLVQLRTGALNPAAVVSDASADQLFGEGGQDWFWANLSLDQTDRVLEFEAVG